MIVKADAIEDIFDNGIMLKANGKTLSIKFNPHAWTYGYEVTIIDSKEPLEISAWFSRSEYVEDFLRLVFEDRWVEAMSKLISAVFEWIPTNLRNYRMLLDSKDRRSVEKRLLNSIWISIMKTMNRSSAFKALTVLENYFDVFEDKELVKKYMDRLSNVEIYMVAKELRKR